MSCLFCCPKCGAVLSLNNKSYYCVEKHCYDVAKEGYVNLLTADKKHSKDPGDNRDMVRARYEFLEKGYYAPLASALSDIIKTHSCAGAVLDAGCGSGYYSRAVEKVNPDTDIYAVDISKEAVRLGAKRGEAHYAVAGVFDLPFLDNAFDVILNVFSPFAFEEYARVLKKSGVLLTVYPAAEHLIELKNALYADAAFENDKHVSSAEFERIEHRNVKFKATLTDSCDITNLLAMTPYYYTSPKDKIESVCKMKSLEITCDFYIDVMKK